MWRNDIKVILHLLALPKRREKPWTDNWVKTNVDAIGRVEEMQARLFCMGRTVIGRSSGEEQFENAGQEEWSREPPKPHFRISVWREKGKSRRRYCMCWQLPMSAMPSLTVTDWWEPHWDKVLPIDRVCTSREGEFHRCTFCCPDSPPCMENTFGGSCANKCLGDWVRVAVEVGTSQELDLPRSWWKLTNNLAFKILGVKKDCFKEGIRVNLHAFCLMQSGPWLVCSVTHTTLCVGIRNLEPVSSCMSVWLLAL